MVNVGAAWLHSDTLYSGYLAQTHPYQELLAQNSGTEK